MGLLPTAVARLRPRLLVCAAVLGVAAVPVALGASVRKELALTAPDGLQTYQLRAGPPATPVASFWRTPSFKWQPVRGAASYRFELATSSSFRPGDVIWATRTSATPAVSLPISLPWVTGGSLYWHVRVIGGNGQSSWSKPASFRMEADRAPAKVAEGPGYARWSPVRGATGYDVWFVNLDRVVSTTTTIVDFRDYSASGAPANAVWRVRADRRLYGPAQAGLLPTTSYGPWSETYTTRVAPNPTAPLATIAAGPAQSQVSGDELMPAFLVGAKDAAELHHVYVATDAACSRIVFNSSIVHGSAFAPRSLETSRASGKPVAPNDGPVFMKDGRAIKPSEASPSSAPGEWARIDLPDGSYSWTVVPVERRADRSYHDLSSPQAACRAAKATFTKLSARPGLATPIAPFATGLSPLGRLLSAVTSGGRFYGFPIVTWKSIQGATQYEVQWSRSSSSWASTGKLKTYATSALLPLDPGIWWYRVRGVDSSIAAVQTLSWSVPARVQIAPPTFRVTRG